MQKSRSFSLSGSECEEQDEISDSEGEEQGQAEISGSEITDHDGKLELCDHADGCEPCEDMEVCDNAPVLINGIGEIISMVRSCAQKDTRRIISIDDNDNISISMIPNVTEQDHENMQNTVTTREKSLENEVSPRENDNAILEKNDSMIIKVDEEGDSLKSLYQDVTSDIALFGNLIKYLNTAKRKGGKGSKKQMIKWDGDLVELREFVELVLKQKGSWKSNLKIPTFKSAAISISWYKWSTKSLLIQGKDAENAKDYMMHLMEEYAKHGKVKSSTQEKNKQESATMRKSSNPAIKAKDSQSARNKEQREEPTKIWKTIEQLSKSLTEADKKITELSNLTKMSLDKCNMQTVQKNPRCKFLYKTAKLLHNHQGKTETNVAQDYKEIITLQQRVIEQEETIKVILKQNHELQKSNEQLKQELVKSGEAILKEQTTNVTYSENRKSDTQSKNSRSPSEVSDIPTVSSNNKPTIVIAGDSIIKDIKGWLMSRNKRVMISSFPGANTEDMKDFLTPLLRIKPDELIINIGTNNLQEESPNKFASDIIRLAERVRDSGVRSTVSSITYRGDDLA